MAAESNACNLTTLRGGKCVFDRPAVGVNPLRDCCSAETSLIGPITERHCSAVKRQHACAALVAALFVRRFPSDISKFVAFGIVDAAKRVLLTWRKSHVLQKVFKDIPVIANGDADAAVSGISLHGRVLASANHCVPSPPFFCPVSASRVSMSSHVALQSVMRSHYTPRLVFV